MLERRCRGRKGAAIEIQVLGTLRAARDGAAVDLGGPRQRRLLAALVVASGRRVSVDTLVEAVFGVAASPQAPDTLRSYVTRLRRALSEPDTHSHGDVVVRDGAGYRLVLEQLTVDAMTFTDGVARARQRLQTGDAEGAVADVQRALDAWKGDAYGDLADEAWVAPEAQRLDEARRSAGELLADALVAAGRTDEAIGVLRDLLTADSYREGSVSRLMVALYRAGRPAEALATYRAFDQLVGDDLGIDPGAALQQLHEQVLARDPALDGAPPRPTLRGYELHERLGRGRHGTVWTALMPGVEREYAIRVYDSDVADSPAILASFDADVRLLVTLDEPTLMPVYDGWREPGSAALVMRRMSGTLSDRLSHGPLTPGEGLDVVQRIGRALAALTRRGRAHGRIQPSSVLVDDRGLTYLAEPVMGAATDDDDADGFLRLAQQCLPDEPPERWSGLDPSAMGTLRLISEVLARLEAPRLHAENPYVGLRAFEVADADRYFGREQVVAELVRRVETQALVLVVGGSGSGKSSIVRAGLVPQLRRREPSWTTTTMSPGTHPMQHLRQALKRIRTARGFDLEDERGDSVGLGLAEAARCASGRLVIVVDQFEELFTISAPAERERFLAVLAQCADGLAGDVRIVATVRADYFDHPLDHPVFGALAAAGAVAVPAMSAAELERAVLGPAAGRLQVEAGLATELVTAVVGQPGALPALQFTLWELAERGRVALRRDDLAELGGVDGAIAHRAEQMYSVLDDSARDALRQILQRLVVLDESAEPARRTVPRAELSSLAPFADDLVESWVDGRLLTTGRRPDTREPTVTFAHEAVLGRWPRLRDWVDEDRERLLALARLTQAAQEWSDLGRDPAALVRGGRLEQAEHLARSSGTAPVVQEFVAEAQALRADEQRQAAEAADAERRTSQRLRRQRWMLAVALVAALAVGWAAVDQRGAAVAAAEEQRARADAGASSLIAASNEAALSDWSRALLLAVEAYRVSPSADTERNVLAMLAQPRPVPTTVWTSEDSLRDVTLDATREWAAVRSPAGSVDVVDLVEGRRVRGLMVLGSSGIALRDGTLVVGDTEALAGVVRVQDDKGDRVVASLPTQVDVTDVEISPDGRLVAVAASSGKARVLTMGSWDVAATLGGPDIVAIQQVTWDETSRTVYAFDASGSFFEWNLDSSSSDGSVLLPIARADLSARDAWQGVVQQVDADLSVADMTVVPGAGVIAVMSALEGPFWVDQTTHEFTYPIRPAQSTLLGGSVGGRGTHVVVDGSSMYIVDPPLDDVANRGVTSGSTGIVADWNAVDVEVRDDGAAVTVGTDGNVTTWHVPDQTALPGSTRAPVLDDSQRVVLSPDGRFLLSWDADVARVLDAATLSPVSSLDIGATDVLPLGAAFLPGEDRLVAHYCSSPPDRPWEPCDSVLASFATDGAALAGPVHVGPARPTTAATVVAGPDAIATVDAAGTVRLHDPTSLEPTGRLDAPDAPEDPASSGLALSPDGSLLALTTTSPESWALWQMQDGPALLNHDQAQGVDISLNEYQGLGTFLAFDGAVPLSDETYVVGQRAAVRVFAVDDENPVREIPDPWNEGLFATEVIEQTVAASGSNGVLASPSAATDGSLLITGVPGSYWLWDPTAPQVLAGPILAEMAVLDPTGDRLFLWRAGGEAIVMSLRPDDLVAAACEAAGRSLTEQEWFRSIGAGEPYAPACPG